MSAWIRMIPIDQATGFLKQMYDKVKTPHGTVDNVMKVHSLRPTRWTGTTCSTRRRCTTRRTA